MSGTEGMRDPVCTDCGASYGMFHGVDCSHPGTWRRSLSEVRDRERYEARLRSPASLSPSPPMGGEG